MTWQHLVTLCLWMAANHLVTHEGVASAIAVWETPSASLHIKDDGDGDSHIPKATVIHVAGGSDEHQSKKTRRGPQLENPTVFTQQQQQQQPPPADTPARKETNPSANILAVEEAGRHDSSVVDTVLASLVDYSKDPKLWRFVHSVIDELDFSQRAKHPPTPTDPRHPRPELHLLHPYTRFWEAFTGGKHEKSQRNNHTQSSGGESHSKTITTRTTASPSTAESEFPWIQQPPEEPPVSAKRTHDSTSTTFPSVSSLDSVNLVGSQPSPSSHFLFHRVFLNETFDNHTRQPYRRPVLALTAVGKDAVKSDKGHEASATNTTRNESSHGNGASVLTDNDYSHLENPVSPRYSSELSKSKDKPQNSGVSDEQDVLSNKHVHHHDNISHHHRYHQPHRLQTFKSQLKFLQRWEERLWRRAHSRPQHITKGL